MIHRSQPIPEWQNVYSLRDAVSHIVRGERLSSCYDGGRALQPKQKFLRAKSFALRIHDDCGR